MPADSTLLGSVGKILGIDSAAPSPGQDRFLALANSSPPAASQHCRRRRKRRRRGGSRREEREGGGGHCPQAGYGLCWIHTYSPKIQLVYIFVFISLVSLVCMLIQCLLCYGTATIPHRQNRSLIKTAPQSFN